MRRRRTELGLMVLAGLLVVAAYTLASLGRTAALPVNIVPFLVAILGLLALAHVAVRRLAPNADPVLLPMAALLNGIGYVVVARLNEDLAALQAMWTAVAIGAFIATLIVVPRAADLERWRYTFALIGVGLLLLPLVPGLGRTIHGARIWVSLGPASFQPGEFAKIALAIFFASYLVERREVLSDFHLRQGEVPRVRHVGPIFMAWGVSLVVMIMERDLGSSLLFFALFVTMLWLATNRAVYLAAGGVLFAGGALFSYTAFSHVHSRVAVWLDPWTTAAGSGFQLVQAMFSFAAGGLAGTGLALGRPDRLPARETDLIFAVIGEELGLLGAAAIIIAFVLLVGSGLRIARSAERPFEQVLAAGLTTILAIQAFIIMGGVTRLVPLTGVTLPFVSYGGSSLLGSYVLLALLVRMSDGSAHRAARLSVAQDETVGVT